MNKRLLTGLAACLFLFPFDVEAFAGPLCDPARELCNYLIGRSRSRPALPSSSNNIRINPSAVPVEKGLGIEAIVYRSSFDFALVKGLGRVGAAISPSNSEETFFGPPGLEPLPRYAERKEGKLKFPSQKLTLATAFNLFGNRQKGLKKFELNLGVMGKYNRETHAVHPGGGLTAIVGPFSLGYARYTDETQVDYTPYGVDLQDLYKSEVESYSASLYLNQLALDYSVLRVSGETPSETFVATASLLFRRAILTASLRTEESDRPRYNYQTKALEAQEKKMETFAGVQVALGKHVLLGAYYNYYLLREVSAGATLFF